MKLISCDESFAAQILAIFNEAILNSTALYEYKPRTPEVMKAWFETKRKGNFPVLGLVNDANVLMGFGSYGTFRAHPAYKYSVEHSIYVAAPFRGQGVGKRVLREVVTAARAQEFHTLIGVIDSQNAASIALHRSLGFQLAGSIRQCGFKFGRWLDADFYQLVLETPKRPLEE